MHVNDLRPLLPGGAEASQHRLLRAAIALGHTDDAQTMLTCEAPGCQNVVSFAAAHSLALVYRRHPAGDGASVSYQCPEEQHFACCDAHAWEALVWCHEQHIRPIHAQIEATPAPAAAPPPAPVIVTPIPNTSPTQSAEQEETPHP